MTAGTPDPAAVDAGDPRLAELARITDELQAAERDAQGWREQRNREIARLRNLPDPPGIQQIAAVAHVRHGYVSRVAISGGNPVSGHDQGRRP